MLLAMSSPHQLPAQLAHRLEKLADAGSLVVLTGAGISAESGIPTFRGKEGYWTVGATEYHPQQMATHAMFSRQPEEVWAWYLYRRGVCRGAAPNPGHQAVVALEQRLGQRFLLITQNVDGLHLRAGNSDQRTYEIHGNIDYARCDEGCGHGVFPLDEGLQKERGEPLTDADRAVLRCPGCSGWARPHVLWFDECYDEQNFRFESSLQAAIRADVLLVVGTSGATNLPMQVGQAALQTGATIVDVNPDDNPFSRIAQQADSGFFLQGPAGQWLPLVVEAVEGAEG